MPISPLLFDRHQHLLRPRLYSSPPPPPSLRAPALFHHALMRYALLTRPSIAPRAASSARSAATHISHAHSNKSTALSSSVDDTAASHSHAHSPETDPSLYNPPLSSQNVPYHPQVPTQIDTPVLTPLDPHHSSVSYSSLYPIIPAPLCPPMSDRLLLAGGSRAAWMAD